MSETTSKTVYFKSNLQKVTVCNCNFNDFVFKTDDTELIELLRNKKSTGDGVLVEEFDGKKLEEDTGPDPIAEILEGIVACKSIKDLDEFDSKLDEKFPDGEGIEPGQKAKILSVFNAQRACLKEAEDKVAATEQTEKAKKEREEKDAKVKEALDAIVALNSKDTQDLIGTYETVEEVEAIRTLENSRGEGPRIGVIKAIDAKIVQLSE